MRESHQAFTEFGCRLRLFVAARSSNRNDVDDIVQEAFLKFHAICRGSSIDNPLGYLYRIANNLLIDRSRRRSALANAVDIDGVSESCLAMAPSQEEGRRLADLQRAYHAALAELSPRCAEVFQLRRHAGMATPDVAARLSITTRMVQKHMVTAMAHLQDRLRMFLSDDQSDAAADDFIVPTRCQIASSSNAHA